MSKELECLCGQYGFDGEFKELLYNMEVTYNVLPKYDELCDELSMVQWLVENTKVNTLECLSEKEKIVYGIGVLSDLLSNIMS